MRVYFGYLSLFSSVTAVELGESESGYIACFYGNFSDFDTAPTRLYTWARTYNTTTPAEMLTATGGSCHPEWKALEKD